MSFLKYVFDAVMSALDFVKSYVKPVTDYISNLFGETVTSILSLAFDLGVAMLCLTTAAALSPLSLVITALYLAINYVTGRMDYARFTSALVMLKNAWETSTYAKIFVVIVVALFPGLVGYFEAINMIGFKMAGADKGNEHGLS